jgi:hypothetical protein
MAQSIFKRFTPDYFRILGCTAVGTGLGTYINTKGIIDAYNNQKFLDKTPFSKIPTDFNIVIGPSIGAVSGRLCGLCVNYYYSYIILADVLPFVVWVSIPALGIIGTYMYIKNKNHENSQTNISTKPPTKLPTRLPTNPPSNPPPNPPFNLQ